MEKIKCHLCGKEYSVKGIGTHIWRSHGDGVTHNPNIGFIEGNRIQWNKGLTTETNDKVWQAANSLKKSYREGRKTVTGSAGWDKKIKSKNAKTQGFGGYNEKAGRSIGEYIADSYGKITYLQSSFELQVAHSLNEHNIKWLRPNYFCYTMGDGERKYYPDFYLPDYDVYLDPKNDYLIQKDFTKIKSVRDQNNVNILIIGKEQLRWDDIQMLLA